tara:strand:+ start:1548 stop:2234 length:687 start_codon:yes stop_codon:yes gene_type:complete
LNFFYSTNIKDEKIYLDKNESYHCIKVLRYKIGDQINVVDGFGSKYLSKIMDIQSDSCELKIIQKYTSKRKIKIHLCISPTKNHKRLEWMVEKIVEIGVDRISFIKCERSIRDSVNLDRLNKIALSAMKQTQNTFLPIIDQCINFSNVFDHISSQDRFIAHLNNKENKHLNSSLNSKRSRCILIGPEGDFTKHEVSLSFEQNFIEVSLGNTRLRTETSGVVSATILNL